MEISFKCPKCNATIEDDIENASFDITADKVSEGTGFATSHVSCDCGEDYEVELTAEPQGKTVVVVGHPNIKVNFEDDTYEQDRE